MSAIENAVKFALNIASDNSHGYDQTHRWGENGDYDCSSLIITAYEQAGVPVKTNGATYTGNMYSVFCRTGFSDVTALINLSTGEGLQRGDVLLNVAHHTAMAVTKNGTTIVHASINENGKATGGKPGDQTGREICTRSYYNKPWNYVLRYTGESVKVKTEDFTATGMANVKDYLNVRSAPNTSAAKVAEYKNGDSIDITGKTSNGWYRCRIYDGTEAYVCGDYVSNVQTSQQNIEDYTATGIATVSTSLNVRSAPNQSAAKVAEFAPGDKIYITGRTDNGWYRCMVYDGTQGYVCGDYVKLV